MQIFIWHDSVFPQVYSQDAYLKCHDAYIGNACHIPQPPPVCFPRVDCKPLGMAEETEITTTGGLQSDLGHHVEITVPPLAPKRSQMSVCMCNESVRTVVVPAEIHMGHDPMLMRTRSYLHPHKPDLYSQGYHGDSYAFPLPHYHPSPSSFSPPSYQNIDWRTYQTYREYINHKGLHAYSRTVQERLDSLRAATASSQTSSNFTQKSSWGNKMRRRSTSHDRSYQGPPTLPPRSVSQDRMTGVERVSRAQDWPPRSVSSDGIIQSAYFHSTDYIEHGEMAPWPVNCRGWQPVPQRQVVYPHSYENSIGGRAAPHQLSCRTDIPPGVPTDRISQIGKNHHKEPQLCKDQRLSGNHITVSMASQQSRICDDALQSSELVKEASLGQLSTSCSLPTPQRQAQLRMHSQDLKGLPVNGCSLVEKVVMREKLQKILPLRHPSYIQAQEHQGALFSSASLNESLDSIPFIGKCNRFRHHIN